MGEILEKIDLYLNEANPAKEGIRKRIKQLRGQLQASIDHSRNAPQLTKSLAGHALSATSKNTRKESLRREIKRLQDRLAGM